MVIFISILAILAILAGIIMAVIAQARKKADPPYTYFAAPAPWVIMAVAGLALLLLANSFTIIPTGYTGVKSIFGQISERSAPMGFNWKAPFVEKIELVNNKQQAVTYKGQIWGETSEKVQVMGENPTVIYRVSPEKSAWIYANVTGGDKGLLTDSIISTAIKDAMTCFPAETVTVRSNIEPKSQEFMNKALDDLYGEGTVTVCKVSIPQMDFEKDYNEALAKRAIAKTLQEQAEIENQTNINRAEAEKKAAIAKAQGEAEAKKIEAEGNASARLIQVEAEAEANRKINETTTEAVLRNKFYNVWDGQLPKVMGEGTIITSVEP